MADSEEIDDPHSPASLWSVAVCFTLFAVLAVVAGIFATMHPASTSSTPSNVASGLKLRRNLMVLLFLASVSRMTSLLIVWFLTDGVLESDSWSSMEVRCLHEFVMLFPDLLFLSAFSVMVCSWVKVHFTSHMVYFPILVALLIAFNVGAYLVVFIEAAAVVILKLYLRFWSYVACTIGVLHLIVSGSFLYYGLTITHDLADLTRKKFPERWIVARLVGLCTLCPLAIFGKGVAYIVWGVTEVHPPVVEKLLVSIAGEWLPAAITLVLLSPIVNSGWRNADLLEYSTESDSPLLPNEQPVLPALSGHPGETRWKQLYPPAEQPNGEK